MRPFLLVLLLPLAALAQGIICSGTLNSGAGVLNCVPAGSPIPPVEVPPPVNIPGTPTTPTGCSSPNVSRTFDHTGQFFDFSLAQGQTAAFQLPPVQARSWAENLVFQSTGTPSDLTAQGALADCPGKFDPPAECTQSGSAWSSIDVYAFAIPYASYCALIPGKTYYFNVRPTNCALNSCPMRTQYWGGLQ